MRSHSSEELKKDLGPGVPRYGGLKELRLKVLAFIEGTEQCDAARCGDASGINSVEILNKLN